MLSFTRRICRVMGWHEASRLNVAEGNQSGVMNPAHIAHPPQVARF